MNPEAQLPEVYPSAADLYQRELASLQQQSPEVPSESRALTLRGLMDFIAWLKSEQSDHDTVVVVVCCTASCQFYAPCNHPVSQLTLSHPELLVAVEMLSSVVLMNQAMDAGDRAALWRQLSSPVTGLSNVEDNYAQRLAERRAR